jgi:hypothetical protein
MDNVVLARLDQFYKPKPYFFYDEGYNGALATNNNTDSDIYWQKDLEQNGITLNENAQAGLLDYVKASPFGSGRYVRN